MHFKSSITIKFIFNLFENTLNDGQIVYRELGMDA